MTVISGVYLSLPYISRMRNINGSFQRAVQYVEFHNETGNGGGLFYGAFAFPTLTTAERAWQQVESYLKRASKGRAIIGSGQAADGLVELVVLSSEPEDVAQAAARCDGAMTIAYQHEHEQALARMYFGHLGYSCCHGA